MGGYLSTNFLYTRQRHTRPDRDIELSPRFQLTGNAEIFLAYARFDESSPANPSTLLLFERVNHAQADFHQVRCRAYIAGGTPWTSLDDFAVVADRAEPKSIGLLVAMKRCWPEGLVYRQAIGTRNEARPLPEESMRHNPGIRTFPLLLLISADTVELALIILVFASACCNIAHSFRDKLYARQVPAHLLAWRVWIISLAAAIDATGD